MEQEPIFEQPTTEQQRLYVSLRDDDATEVPILGTKKKYKLHWLRNGQIEKLSRLLVGKSKTTDNEDGEKRDIQDAILSDNKIACKAAAIFLLNRFWKLRLFYWMKWRWFYYVKEYGQTELFSIIAVGVKKKIVPPLYFETIMLLIGAKDSLMTMRTEEVERMLQGRNSEPQQETESPANG